MRKAEYQFSIINITNFFLAEGHNIMYKSCYCNNTISSQKRKMMVLFY